MVEETVKLAKLIESTGVVALAVHGRTKEERPRHKNRNHFIKAVAEALSIPVIANGGSNEISVFDDIEEFKRSTGASSVMIARQAEWNCSVFRKEGKLPLYDVIRSYLKYAFQYNNNDINTKYCVLQMMHETMDAPEGQSSLTAKTNEEFSEIWGMQAQFQQAVQDRKRHTEGLLQLSEDSNHGYKRWKADDGLPLIELPIRFDKKCYLPAMSPKQSLHEWCKRCNYKNPVYKTEERAIDRSFNSRVLVDGKWYATPFGEKRKQYAEQSAAMCCLLTHGIHDGRIKEPVDQTPELRHKWHQLAKSESHNTNGSKVDSGQSQQSIKEETISVKDSGIQENSVIKEKGVECLNTRDRRIELGDKCLDHS